MTRLTPPPSHGLSRVISYTPFHSQLLKPASSLFLSYSSGRQAAKLFSMPHLVQQETTTAYLENQVASALAIQSSHEYRHWLLIYARYLVKEGFEYRLRELCKDLLGPVHSSSGSQWESTVVGLRKRDLLKELLPVIGQNLRFQRLFTEYQEQLDILKDK
ncbi:PREDICTED: protein HIRA-like [Thamnophis sirtalis]|uniref:Protein HIRA-like n=1 Tax=Thamnophis sirtalis TaxID=35019 RepID=A0A6I9YNG1_9SAUR|nr:PREDICTED: protein HIRA-like [Thamnophis sirtalis]